MSRKGPSVLFAALLLVAQLLFGVMSAGAVTYEGTHPCGGCPTADSTGMSHAMDSGTDRCGSDCSHDGTTGTRHPGCGTGCAMAGGGHCGSSVSPALLHSTSFHPIVITDDFGSDLRPVDLPDSPLFDFLRPPTRG
jgi:hypothetical protein